VLFRSVLHSQLGQYVDCMVSFPPQPVSFPEFPPLPEPAPVAPKIAPAPPRPVVPPLIIIGTPVTNRVPPPAPKPAPTNLPPPEISKLPPEVVPEVRPPDDVPMPRPGGSPAQLKIAAGLLPRTNAVSVPSESPRLSRVEAFAMGAVFLVVGGLAVLLFGRTRPAKKD
jgi:periplasmic protein TonB